MAMIHKVVLVKQCKGPGGVIKPAGTVIEGPNAHRLVELGVARPFEEESARLAHIERLEQERAAESQPTEPQAEPEQPAEPENPPETEVKGEAANANGNGEAAAQQSQE